ncbi:hypothetical protein RQP46_006726 [Phenoliferia psychrophenolica]
MLRLSWHGWYFLWPLAACLLWTATLLGLLLLWIVDDHHKKYRSDEASVVYISNVGGYHKALFIPGAALTFVTYTGTLITERWLRHLRRIPGVLRVQERWIDIVAVILGFCGGLALLMLSIFNCFQYGTAHWSLTVTAVVCIIISVVCQTLETTWLQKDHPDRKHLRRNGIWKISFAVAAIVFAIIFGAAYGVSDHIENTGGRGTKRFNVIKSLAATCEWLIAFLFSIYLFVLVLDLWPATKTRGHHFDPTLIEADRANTLHLHKDGRPGAPRRPKMAFIEWDTSYRSLTETYRHQDGAIAAAGNPPVWR